MDENKNVLSWFHFVQVSGVKWSQGIMYEKADIQKPGRTNNVEKQRNSFYS